VSQLVDPLNPVKGALPVWQRNSAPAVFGNSFAEGLAVAAGDVTLLLDEQGVVLDMAFGDSGLATSGLDQWIGKAWIDTVTIESRPKVTAMIEAARDSGPRWRQVNQTVDGNEAPIRYLTMGTEKPGWMIAIGRDLRSTAALQQRLLQTQQTMERDYIRLRQAETRYRLLFAESAEAVLIIDAATRRITEANPAALSVVGSGGDSLVGRTMASVVHTDDREQVIAMFGSVAAAENVDAVEVRLAKADRVCRISAALFRQGRGAAFLVRLSVAGAPVDRDDPDMRLVSILERIPDAFVITDDELNIVAANAAFLEMTQFARKEQIRGEALSRFVGRPGIDLGLLTSQLREHGAVSNFATVMRDRFDGQDDIEISAVAVTEGSESWIGFSIRTIGRMREQRPAGESVTRSVEQLTELVGRVSLKEIVRESSDLIERLCIEAALTYTSDNRASAAEILGLSRQSLYSKLHRHGLANGAADPGAAE
jgi:transcriptional regulator PpsR